MLPDPLFLNVHMYGIMIAVGILCAFLFLFWYGKYRKVEERFIDFIFYNGIASIMLGFGSAMLFQATYNYIDDPSRGFRLGSGMTFIGGLIGGVVVFLGLYLIFRKRYNTRLYEVISALPCSILVAHAFGRIGCFFAGCCYGKPTDSFLGVQFPDLAHKVHPTQLYEAAFLFVMFGICFYLVVKKNFQHNLSLYLITYGIFRFLIEYVRGDDRGELVSIVSPSQFWSIFMVIAGVAIIFPMNYLIKKGSKVEPEAAEEIEEIEEEQEVQE